MNELKPIPKQITKEVLVQLYISQMTESEILESIREIQKEVRGNKYNKYDRKVHFCEFLDFVAEYENPTGYNPVLSDEQIDKRLLRIYRRRKTLQKELEND